MFWAAIVVSGVISLGYLAIALTITQRVLLVDEQWRGNPLAVATAGIFLSCGVGHTLHLVHLLEFGSSAPELYDTHMVLWDATTAAVATWYWSLRSRFSALSGSGELFRDAVAQERLSLAGVLEDLFDGVVVLPAGPVTADDLPEPLKTSSDREAVLSLVAGAALGAHTVEVRAQQAVLEVRASSWADQVVLAWRDVTELREAQRARLEVEARLAAAFDAAPGAMAVLRGGTVARGNRALSTLAGGDVVEGRTFGALFEESAQAAVQAQLAAALGGHDTGTWEVRLHAPEGPGRWTEVCLAVVQHGPGPVELVAHLADVDDRKAYEARLRHTAEHDPLTGLGNRRRFDEELRRQYARRDRGHDEGALLLIDLDHFKEVNDTFGHPVGDALLVSVAELLRRHVREADVVARLGGDEFAVLCPDATRAEAVTLARRLCEEVRLLPIATPVPSARRVTCSLGLTGFTHHPSPGSALVAADLALYAAKAAGRDTFAVDGDDGLPTPRRSVEARARVV